MSGTLTNSTNLMRKYRLTDVRLPDILMDKALEKYKVDFKWVRENSKRIMEEHGVPWFKHYTFDSIEEYTAWKKFCLVFLTTRITPKLSPKQVSDEFEAFDEEFGLSWNFRQNVQQETPDQ